MAFVVDVSIAAKWFLPDERNSAADSLLDRVFDEGASVPALFRWEMQSILLGAECANRIDSDDVDAALDSLRDLPIILEPSGERFFSGNGFGLHVTIISLSTMPRICAWRQAVTLRWQRRTAP